mmetsp:Transcript_8163/g.24570  ORF Transcript_8163/g.24570 Transcript_8163/m.24570 type:complete len:213 (-) Transcript_8163:103-741(-)|eukprot:CAMPEP_0198730964 /NCGR_PEP_ID=MMETSP1475-20131203/27328_1 /TAXON_ID= ORGANISM="Unidentified sp., Strain CCMP1999" /NCGR_SAMPLE_ID=MMETSP1475 /ASSEMBLY_ACC=CAM_ASM_001111 /LENGTH=212 /DNA_ID=CAMNT_0044493857 /DNA_START=111 /DNA_END=749 /DNA_ORIENTATION=+
MEALYRDARRAVVESRAHLEGLEKGGNAAQFAALQGNLQALNVTVQQLATNLGREPPPKKEIWRQRLVQLDDELAELRRGQERCASRARAAETEARMRDELLSRRKQRADNGGDATIQMDFYESEAKSLKSSSTMSDQILETGTATLEMLLAQRTKLKGAKKKMLDVANQLGVSKDLIRSIERREAADFYLVLGGIALCIIVLFLLWFFRRR